MTWRLPPRLRTLRELLGMSARTSHSFVLGAAGFALAVLSLPIGIVTSTVHTWLGLASLALLIVGSILSYVGFRASWREVRAQRSRIAFAEVDGGALIAGLKRHGTAYADYKPVVFRAQRALVHPGIDAALAATPVPLRVKDSRFGVPERVAEYLEPLLWDRFLSGAILFDGRLARLAGDLDPAAPGRAVAVQETGYYAGECTNDLAGREVIEVGERGHGRVVFRGRDLVEDGGKLVEFADNRCADVIGVSTLGVTRDRHLVILRQTRGSAQSPRLLAPSGSGSAEPIDWDGATTLQAFLANAMARELREESGLTGETRVIGFARVLSRGGKPEFFGVSRLDDDWAAVEVAGEERAFMSVQEACNVVVDRGHAEFVASLKRFARSHEPGFSFPLYLNLRALLEYADRDWSALEAFITAG